MGQKTQPQPELIFDTEIDRASFGVVLDGVLCYVKSSQIHYVYDTLIGSWKIVTTTSNICVQIIDKLLVNNLTEQSLLGTMTKSNILPIGFLSQGRNVFGKQRGNHNKGVGNVTCRVKMNSIIILSTGSINSGVANNAGYELEFDFTVKTYGVRGTISAQGFWVNRNTGKIFPMQNLSDILIDTTIEQTLDVTWQYSSSNAGNNIKSTNSKFTI